MSASEGMKSYWDEKITWWAASSYEDQPRGMWEQFMAKLRRSVHARAVIALELLRPHIKDKTVLDIGCGNGHFLKGCLDLGAKHVYGVDIAPQAIEMAKNLAEQNNYSERSTFYVGRAGDDEFPDADFVTGFGLLDWLRRRECMKLFNTIAGKKFVFSFSEQDGSFDEWVHHFYLVERLRWFGNGVRVYHHPRQVMLDRLAEAGIKDVEVVVRKEMRFGRLIHNLHGE